MVRHLTRLERNLREIHGEALEFVEVTPQRYAHRRMSFSTWWAQTPPLERFWKLWLWSILAIVCAFIGATLALFLTALLS